MKTNMTKLLILPVLILFALISCNKASNAISTSTGTFLATVDDIPYVFTLPDVYNSPYISKLKDSAILDISTLDDSASAAYSYTDHSLSIGGATSDSTKYLSFYIDNLVDPITVGTYTSVVKIDTLNGVAVPFFPGAIAYATDVLNGSSEYVGTSNAGIFFYSIITITSIDSTNVQGTFSGLVGKYLFGSSPFLEHTITNGKFNLPVTIRH